jgi:hypothetical protein
MNETIDDKVLINWFVEKHTKIPFIDVRDFERIGRTEELLEDISYLDSSKKLYQQKDLLIKIWGNLVANAIVFLKSVDQREFYHDDGDYGIDELGSFFNEYCKFERLLYGSSEYYRDHVSHVFRVFLLGEYLIEKGLPSKSFADISIGDDILIDDSSDKKECGEYTDLITPQEKEAMWCIISLTHDLGYPTEVVHKIHEQMRTMMNIFNIDISYLMSHQSHFFNDFIIRLISSNLLRLEDGDGDRYTTHLQSKYYLKFSRSKEKWDHGLESCIVLVKSLVYFLETDCSLDNRKSLTKLDARQFLIRQRILRSIAAHNCNYIYHLRLDLAFLLRLADEMQEWDRPKLSDLFSQPLDSTLFVNKFMPTCIKYTIQFSTGGMKFDEKAAHKDVKNYFKRKIDDYIMIMRSAVDGKHREFTIEFTVKDEVESSDKYQYVFIHKNPKEISIKFGKRSDLKSMDINDFKLDWDEFLVKYNEK